MCVRITYVCAYVYYVRMCVRMYVCMCITYVCMCVCVCVCVLRTYVCAYVCVYVYYVRMCVRMYVRMCVRMLCVHPWPDVSVLPYSPGLSSVRGNCQVYIYACGPSMAQWTPSIIRPPVVRVS